jgi:WD40 repeat protein
VPSRALMTNAAALEPREQPDDPHARIPLVRCQCCGGDTRRPSCRLGSSDDTLRLWDLESGNEIANFTGDSEFDTFAFTPNCRMIVAKERPGRVHILQIVEADELSLQEAIQRSSFWSANGNLAINPRNPLCHNPREIRFLAVAAIRTISGWNGFRQC